MVQADLKVPINNTNKNGGLFYVLYKLKIDDFFLTYIFFFSKICWRKISGRLLIIVKNVLKLNVQI